MKIIADTNIIVRLVVDSENESDQRQAIIAAELIDRAEEVIIPAHVFCEMAWVLSSAYGFRAEKIGFAIKSITGLGHLVFNEDEITAGLRMLAQGGDFADGVNACAGRGMTDGAPVFVSFDKQAVRLLAEQGISALVPK